MIGERYVLGGVFGCEVKKLLGVGNSIDKGFEVGTFWFGWIKLSYISGFEIELVRD